MHPDQAIFELQSKKTGYLSGAILSLSFHSYASGKPFVISLNYATL